MVIEWQDTGIPQVAQFPLELPDAEFPSLPTQMQSNGSELLAALRTAAGTADKEATRYALNRIQLRPGKPGRNNGQVVATDSRQLLVQSGFAFPWEGEVLIPTSRIFTCRELHADGPAEIGRTVDWLTIRTGRWTVHLLIEKDARFPHVDDHIPRTDDAVSALHVSDTDAEFLTKAIGRLPAASEADAPVTVELGGQVAIRAQGDDQPAATELVLIGSGCTGQTTRFNTNRKYLARALTLGFREVCFYGPEAPAYCRDERRSYVWALLGREEAIKPQKIMTRIESPVPEEPAAPALSNPRRLKSTMPKTTSTTNGRATGGVDHDDSNNASLLDQAETLKGTLTEALAQTRDLIAALKRQKKQTRLMRSTLQSLKQLQTIDA